MALTQDDITAIREMMVQLPPQVPPIHPPNCLMGLTTEEATSLKRFLKASDTTATWVGKIVVTFIVMALLSILTKGFWVSILNGLKGTGQ